MKIDWFTFAAQIINFVILLALLKRFLYGPILKAIADREAEIAARFNRAAEEQSAAAKKKNDFDSRTAELAHEKQRLLAQAASEVDEWKTDRLAEAKAEANASRADWFQELDRERQQLRDRLLEQYRQHALKLAEGIVECLADVDGQRVIVDAFVRQVRNTAVTSETTAGSIHDDSGKSLTVRSAFELSETQRAELREALKEAGHDPGLVQFRVDESLICGIEIRTRDHEISWNARESLDHLASAFSRDLEEILSLPDELITSSEVAHAG